MKQRVLMLFLLPILTLAIVTGVVFAHLSSARAVSTGKFPINGMKPYGSHISANVSNGNLTYHGGPVMAGATKAYLIFWEPTGSVVTANYNKLNKRYFRDIGASSLYEINEQYTSTDDKAPEDAFLAGTFLDTHPYPANPMTDAQVQAEVTSAMSANGWTASIHHIFFVYTASGEHNVLGDTNGFCAYHSAFGTNTLYAAMIYPTVLAGCLVPLPSPNNDQIADSAINFDSHEQMEAATDPLLNAWFNVDIAHEIGDECDFVFGPRDQFGGDVTFNGHDYIVQEEWNNATSGCALGTSGP